MKAVLVEEKIFKPFNTTFTQHICSLNEIAGIEEMIGWFVQTNMIDHASLSRIKSVDHFQEKDSLTGRVPEKLIFLLESGSELAMSYHRGTLHFPMSPSNPGKDPGLNTDGSLHCERAKRKLIFTYTKRSYL